MKLTLSVPLAAALLGCAAIPVVAQEKSVERQIAEAVSPLPETLRRAAAVLGYGYGRMVVLREGTNTMICLADDPMREGFHAACYHESLGPFMARGRELRAQGKNGAERRAIRIAEIEAGTLAMPDHPTALYSLTRGNLRSGNWHSARCSRPVRYLRALHHRRVVRHLGPAGCGASVADGGGHGLGAHHVPAVDAGPGRCRYDIEHELGYDALLPAACERLDSR